MNRLNLFLAVSLLSLAAFVGHQALDTHRQVVARSQHTASYGATPVETSTAIAEPARDSKGRPSSEVADVRRRLELSAPGTYIGEILAERDSAIVRWPDRRTSPLRVWVQPMSNVKDFSPRFVPLVRSAFVTWSETGVPISFSFVVDSSLADVRVTWLDHFSEKISGKTLWAHDDHWWIVDASIQIAVHHKSGETLDTSAVRAIALHEVGHLIGLDHTTDSSSIMAAKVRVQDLSASDRATALLLYALPPGRVGSVSSVAAGTR